MVLIVTNKEDIVSDIVLLSIQELGGEVLRLNTEDSYRLTVDRSKNAPSWSVTQGDRRASSQEVTGVWYRRPVLQEADRWPESIAEFVADQWFEALRGLSSIPGPTWVNNPFCAARAENKLIQMEAARRCGLQTPSTIVTSDVEAISSAFQTLGSPCVVKALTSPWMPSSNEFVFTSELGATDTLDPAAVAAAPFIVQKRLSPKQDIRVTIIGTEIYAASVTSYLLDWRRDESQLEWTETELPQELQNQLRALCVHLGLEFGAIDLVAFQGDYYFLEINPSGEWSWLEGQTGMPLAKSLAKLLMEG